MLRMRLKFVLVFDRLAFLLFFKWYYQRIFSQYGQNIRWGRDFRHRLIPSSVRISCPGKIQIGDNCQFDEGVYLQCHNLGEGIVIAAGTRINAHTHILSYSKITIGSQVLIAPFSLLASGDHGCKRTDISIMQQPHEMSGEITIGAGSWIAQGAKILGGSHIGCNSVVAAGSVVKGVFQDYSVIAGVPGRCVRLINR